MADLLDDESQNKQHKILFLCCIFAILVMMILLGIYAYRKSQEVFVLERPKVLNELNLQPTNNPNTP